MTDCLDDNVRMISGQVAVAVASVPGQWGQVLKYSIPYKKVL